jgi:hypothetical protein
VVAVAELHAVIEEFVAARFPVNHFGEGRFFFEKVCNNGELIISEVGLDVEGEDVVFDAGGIPQGVLFLYFVKEVVVGGVAGIPKLER